MATNAPVTDRQAAVKMLRDEHNQLAELLMGLVDLVEDFQAGRQDLHRLRVDRVRQATGHMLRKSLIEREAALAALSPDHDIAELALAQMLLDVCTEAEEPRDDDIVELAQKRMPAVIYGEAA